MPEELTPVIREEEYLAAIAGQDVTPPDPATRKEEWLDAIADHLDAVVPTPAAADSGKVLTAGDDGSASWQTPSGGGAAPVTITNASLLSEITSFITALITASTDTAIRIKRGVTKTGDEELFEAFKSIHENGSPLEATLLGTTFRMHPVFSRNYTIDSEEFYYAQFVNEFFSYTNNYKMAYEIKVSKTEFFSYDFELAMSCVKMTLLSA